MSTENTKNSVDEAKEIFAEARRLIDTVIACRDEEVALYKEAALKAKKSQENALSFMKAFQNAVPDWSEISKWQEQHLTQKHPDIATQYGTTSINASKLFTYAFIPVNDGMFSTCKCMLCDEEYDFTNV